MELNGRAWAPASPSILEDMHPTAQPSSRRTLHKDEIRLLIYDKERSETAGLLSCQTRILKLSDINSGEATPYTALSYVWGDAAITKPLICDGVEVKITANLEYALSAIWDKYPEISTWADALSITQNNLSERNHQVSLMGEIFRSATRVFVSLGPPLEGDNRFWNFLRNLSCDNHPPEAQFGDELEDFRLGFRNKLNLGLNDLIGRPWFCRAWTYQEIRLAVAAEVFCGDSFMPWNNLVESLTHLKSYLNSNATTGFWITALNRGFYAFMKQQGLMLKRTSAVRAATPNFEGRIVLPPHSLKEKPLELLVDGWTRDASDARDKIYAFTSSLLASSSYVELRPDYTLDTRDTFIRLIKVLINNENDLEFLKYARGVDEHIQFTDEDFRRYPEDTPLRMHCLPEAHMRPSEHENDLAVLSEVVDLPSWTCDWRSRGWRTESERQFSKRDRLGSQYFCVRQNALPLRQSVYNFDKRLVLRGVALARAGYLQKETARSPETSVTFMPLTFSKLPNCALHRASGKTTSSVSQRHKMFDRDVRSGEKSLRASNMLFLLLQTLLHDQSGCDCPDSLEKALVKAWCPYKWYPKSYVHNLDWLFLLDGFAEPVILRPHTMPGDRESSRSEIGFKFVSACPLDVTGEEQEWLNSPFAYGDVALY